MEEKINEEIKKWEPYLYNYDNLAFSILLDALAYIPKEKREEYIKKVDELLIPLEGKPITGKEMFDSVENDLKAFTDYSTEAQYALRTLQWVKDEAIEKESK